MVKTNTHIYHKNIKQMHLKRLKVILSTCRPCISKFGIWTTCQNVNNALHNAYIEQLKFLAVVCAQTMLQKSQKIYDGTYLFPGADNCEENRENSIFVSLTL